ncbi:MAG TPA: hypothetical protein PLK90_03590 [Clostridiales bacterium]|nr:hypothetical protein [Clostridiales bacterium]HQP69462.1 hypothetical protein [Clostridiales bacterium]
MPSEQYARGNGAKALKKRFNVFSRITKYVPLALIIATYVILQAQVKAVSRENSRLLSEKNILNEQLERLNSDYDKMIPYGEIRDYAVNSLSMNSSASNIRTFAVLDKDNIFEKSKRSDLPVLFETDYDLASIELQEPAETKKEQ